jgi:hypothetical protein
MRFRVVPPLALVVALLSSCTEEEEPIPSCVTIEPGCKPLYDPPTFDVLYTNLFKPSCASVTGTCHTGRASGGLDMSTADLAYAGLSMRVVPSDPACSAVVVRTTYGGRGSMPPGDTHLSDGQKCAIQRWIGAGAPR